MDVRSLLLYHILSGQAFFTGMLLVVIASCLPLRRSGKAKKKWSPLLILLGSLLILLSTTPLDVWLYLVWGIGGVFWLGTLKKEKWNRGATAVFVTLCFMTSLFELPWHWPPHTRLNHATVTVIGDSVTAGVDSGTSTWLELLQNEREIAFQDFSHVGETVRTAVRRLEGKSIRGELVILEIGGNDLLGGTTSEEFARSLEKLLRRVCEDNRRVMMFELPLPPFKYSFGRIQRRLAAKYDVAMIPKRCFLSILLSDGATLDGIHLSQSGQRKMARLIGSYLSVEDHSSD